MSVATEASAPLTHDASRLPNSGTLGRPKSVVYDAKDPNRNEIYSPDVDLAARYGRDKYTPLGDGRFRLMFGQHIQREIPGAPAVINAPAVLPVPSADDKAAAAMDGYYGKLEEHNVKKLREIAAAEEIDLGGESSKDKIIEIIRRAKK